MIALHEINITTSNHFAIRNQALDLYKFIQNDSAAVSDNCFRSEIIRLIG